MLLALCGWRTLDQLGNWHDSETLLRHAIAVTPDNALAHTNLGTVLREQGRHEDEVAEYREALKIRPEYYLAHGNLGVVMAESGKLTEAVEEYQAALRSKPDDSRTLNNLGVTLATLGRMNEAEQCFRDALRPRSGQCPRGVRYGQDPGRPRGAGGGPGALAAGRSLGAAIRRLACDAGRRAGGPGKRRGCHPRIPEGRGTQPGRPGGTEYVGLALLAAGKPARRRRAMDRGAAAVARARRGQQGAGPAIVASGTTGRRPAIATARGGGRARATWRPARA